jgi:hemerythrin-like metal-binding protein
MVTRKKDSRKQNNQAPLSEPGDTRRAETPATAEQRIAQRGAGNIGQVTVSLGVATVYPGRTEAFEKIVELADMALYRAKMGGRNRFEVAIHGTAPSAPMEETPGFVELSWHEDFSCGNATIDDQHKKLFKTSSKLLSAISGGSAKAEFLALIESLLEETRRHFQDEEEILSANKYPLAGEHHQIHSGLLAKAAELSAKFTSNQLTIGELFTFLANDIIWHHMYVEDRKFFPYL